MPHDAHTHWSVEAQAIRMSAAEIGSRAHVINFRLDRGWTQARAAAWYGCTERSWRRYERGERRVPGPLLKRIGRFTR